MPVDALLSTKRKEGGGKRERDLRKGLFGKDCLEIRVCGSELCRWLPLQFAGFPFSLRGVVCGFNK